MTTYFKPALVAGALALAAGPAAAVDYYMAAKAYTKTMPDGSAVPMWGYVADPDNDANTVGDCYEAAGAAARRACVAALPSPVVPGPRLTVPSNQTILRIFLSNGLPEPTSVLIPGQQLPFSATDNGPTWNDGTTGARGGDLTKRVRSFGREAAANGGRRVFTWAAFRGNPINRPGSFIYHSGTHPQKQAYMGLYGAVTKDVGAGLAYPGVAYANEAVLFYSEIDPDLNAAIDELYNPTGLVTPYTTSIGYHPRWFLVNGEPYVAGTTPDIPAGGDGTPTLLRFFSAAGETHVPTLQGLHMTIHAEDGIPYTWQDGTTGFEATAPREQYSAMLPPLKTKDAIIVANEGRYAVYDGNGYMTNPSDPDDFGAGDIVGGMLRFLSVGPAVQADTVTILRSRYVATAQQLRVWATSDELVNCDATDTVALSVDGFTPTTTVKAADPDVLNGCFVRFIVDGITANPATVTVTSTVGGTDTEAVPFTELPVANPDAYGTNEDIPLNIAAPGLLDGDLVGGYLTAVEVLQAVVDTPPSQGAVTVNLDGSLTYTPNLNFNGTDSFTYVAQVLNTNTSGIIATSGPATVTITVAAVNDAPDAVADDYTTPEDTALVVNAAGGVLANDSDAEGDPLTASVNTAPSNGTLVLAADGSFTYTPNANFNGPDPFTYDVSDGNGGITTGTVTVVTVTAVNDPPVAGPDSYPVLEDNALTVTAPGVLGNDSDIDVGDVITIVGNTNPANGALSLALDGSFTYTPNANFNGTDGFTYDITDGIATVTGAVTINVTAVNDPPVITSTPITTATEGVTYSYGVTVVDPDVPFGDVLAFSLTTAPAGMSIDGATGGISWVPGAAQVGLNNVTVQVQDSALVTDTQSFTIDVAPAGGPPIVLYLSLTNASGTVGGVAYADEDILSWDGTNFAMVFDGSVAGVGQDVYAFDVLDANTILIAFSSGQTVPGVGAITNNDIVRYDVTTNSFTMFLDGSLVGLSGNSDRLDAIQLLPDGRLLVSTRSGASVPGITGTADEDLLAFTPTVAGDYTSGTWAFYFDGSDVGLTNGNAEDVDGVSVAAGGDIYLSTWGNFSVAGAAGQDEDVFICTPSSLGATTACSFSPFLNGTALGLGGEDVDAIDLP